MARPKPPDKGWLEYAIQRLDECEGFTKDTLTRTLAELAELREMEKWCDARGEKYWQRKNMTWVADDVYTDLRAKADKWDEHEAGIAKSGSLRRLVRNIRKGPYDEKPI